MQKSEQSKRDNDEKTIKQKTKTKKPKKKKKCKTTLPKKQNVSGKDTRVHTGENMRFGNTV